ncbi:MAG: GAF domain-containing protein [Actinobacteria bacterium]|nr:MAG: GAF domain-containing protein [Actinomycetota bacterium]
MRGALADGAVLIDEDSEYLRATDVDASGQHDPPSIEAANRVPSEVPFHGPHSGSSSVPTRVTRIEHRPMHMTQSNNAAANRSERDLEALASVGRGLRTSTDLDRQLGLILRLAGEAVGANRASVMLLNRFILHGPVTDPRFEGVDPTIDSSLCLPLAAEGNEDGVLGVLNLTRQPGDPFTVEDLRLASSLADLASVAVEKAFLYASLRERESRVARLLEAAMNAQETERRRVVEEMHDGFLEGLSGLFLQAEIARITLGRTAPSEAVAAVEQIQDAIQRTSARLRDYAFKVCPESVGERGLAPTLAAMVQEVGATSSLDGHFDNRSGDQRLPGGVETILFRVAQEALRNVVTNGGARQVWVALESNRDEARLIVRSDGWGIEPGPSAEHPPGTTGLDTMRERLALAGGSLEVVTEPEGGTRISARIPLAAFR